MTQFVLYLVFVLSGAAGLIYESIWSRYLGLFVGHSAYAQIIVLTIFLGGMSLGAWGTSRTLRAAHAAAARVRARRAYDRRYRIRLPRCVRGHYGARVRLDLPAPRGQPGAAHRREVVDRQRADPAAIRAARHDLPAHERGRAASRAAAIRPRALPALFREQPGRLGRRARRGVLPAAQLRPREHAARGGDPQLDRVRRHARARSASPRCSRRAPKWRATNAARPPRRQHPRRRIPCRSAASDSGGCC